MRRGSKKPWRPSYKAKTISRHWWWMYKSSVGDDDANEFRIIDDGTDRMTSDGTNRITKET